jgi:hypothetical protein
MEVRIATVNEEARTIEAVLTTESRVAVYDWRSGEIIEEILLVDGADVPRQLPLLNVHSRYSIDDVLGSVKGIKTEEIDGVRGFVGRLGFVDGDEASERAWNKYRQGHMTDVSIGYRVTAATEVEPGNTASIDGKDYKAGKLRLRIATAWKLREVSVVPIGADQAAKTRNDILITGGIKMPKELREYLESIGLRAEATDAEAWQYLAGLEGDERAEANRHLMGLAAQHDDSADDQGDDSPNDDRRDDATDQQPQPATVAELRAEAGDAIPADVVLRVAEQSPTLEEARRMFLEHIRTNRQPGARAPAGHSRSHETSCTVRSLAAGMLIASGHDPVSMTMHDGRRLRRSERITEQDADFGDEFRQLSAVDLMRECVRLDGGRHVRDPEDAIREAVSGTSFDRVFTTNIYAELIAGWEEEGDSSGWCQEEDVPNFLEQEDITLDAKSGLDLHTKGGTAKHATAEDNYETYKMYRFSKQFVVDEMDILNDRLGALLTMPREMGMAARRVRPDIVYSILLANAALDATNGALFNSTAETTAGGHANLGSTALGSAGLKAAITAMMGRRIGTGKDAKVINVRPRFLIVPPALKFTAEELLTSARLFYTGDTDAVFTEVNVLSGQGIVAVPEARIDATGVTDPISGTAYTGSATNYFLAGSRRTIKVLRRRGTGGIPQLRRRELAAGQWGTAWDIKHDIGASAVDYRGLYKGNS